MQDTVISISAVRLIVSLLFLSVSMGASSNNVEATVDDVTYRIVSESGALSALSVPIDQQPQWEDSALAQALAGAVGGQLGTAMFSNGPNFGPIFFYDLTENRRNTDVRLDAFVFAESSGSVEPLELTFTLPNGTSVDDLDLSFPIAVVTALPPEDDGGSGGNGGDNGGGSGNEGSSGNGGSSGDSGGLSREELAVITLLLSGQADDEEPEPLPLAQLENGECVAGEPYEPISTADVELEGASLRLLLRGGGFCEVEFDVSISGTVLDLQVVDCDPRDLLEEATIAAIEQWRYPICVLDGEPRVVRNVTQRFDFGIGRR